LAERIVAIHNRLHGFEFNWVHEAATLIDLYVRVKEAEASYNAVTEALEIAKVGCFGYHPTNCSQCAARDYWRKLKASLAAARAEPENKAAF